MSLRWRIMGAIVFTVVLTVLTSVGVGYYATQARLGVFVEQVGGDEASQVARSLSREYTASGGWAMVGRTLAEGGYVYDGAPQGERSEQSEGEHSEAVHQERVRVVIVDAAGEVVKDNMSQLLPGTAAPSLEGHREAVFDLTANQPVGQVYVDVNREFLSSESHGFLNTLLYITLIAGALTVGVAVLLAALLSRRITAPVTALTEATQANSPGRHDPPACKFLGRAGPDERGLQRNDHRPGNPAGTPQAAD